jgi:hypothetical protein
VLPVTEVEPFQCPGDEFYQRHLEKMAQIVAEEDALRQQKMQVKARPILAVAQVARVAPSTKPLTEAKSPLLHVTQRARERSLYDDAERKRRQQEEEQRRQHEEEQQRQEAASLKAWREKELAFKALRRSVKKTASVNLS